MDERSTSNLSEEPLIFDPAVSFAFPHLSTGHAYSRAGMYNPLLDVMQFDASGSNVMVETRVRHEIAHRLFNLDGPVLRLARTLAGATYSYTWTLLGYLAEARVDLSGLGAANLHVVRALDLDEARQVVPLVLRQIMGFHRVLRDTLDRVRVLYEIVAISVGLAMLADQADEQWIKAAQVALVNQEAREQAHALYHAYPYYWVVRQVEQEGASHDELHRRVDHLIAERKRLRSEGKPLPDDAEHYRDAYEDLFREMYSSYQRRALGSLQEALWSTNRGITSPFTYAKTPEGTLQLVLNDHHPAWLWATGKMGPGDDAGAWPEAWRVCQLIEATVMKLPAARRVPLRLMTTLDLALYEEYFEHAYRGQESTSAGDAVASPASFSEPSGSSISSADRSLLLLTSNGSAGSVVARLNERLSARVQDWLGTPVQNAPMGDERWWRWLLLFETLRVGLSKGVPVSCPLRGSTLNCPVDCPLKVNLAFLANHSDLVSSPFCDRCELSATGTTAHQG